MTAFSETDDPVSVVVPAYDAEPFIGDCLESILSQTSPVSEILVVDDGSTDRTSEIVSGFGGPVRLIRQENAGVSAARNRGLEEATGPLIAFCDADDLWLPGKLRIQTELLAGEPGASAAFSGVLEVDERLDPSGPIPCPPLHEITVLDLLWHRTGEIPPQIPSTLLARKEKLDAAGGWDPDLSDAADWDLAVRLRRLGRFVGTCEPLVRYRVHSASMSSKTRLRAADAKRLFEKILAASPPGDLSEIRAAWGGNVVVLAASLARGEGAASALPWFLTEFARNPWWVGRALISRINKE